jgi:hypothetical protein
VWLAEKSNEATEWCSIAINRDKHCIRQLMQTAWGEHPIETIAAGCYVRVMNPLLLIVILLLLFGGGGFYFGGPVIGGGGLGLILIICLLVYVMGGFRTKR